MPLYKKTASKIKVKTQNSFISPLLSQASATQNKIKDFIKDDYKDTLLIPTKKKLLEPLTNVANVGNLLETLQQKKFQDSSTTVIEVSKTKETWSKTDIEGKRKLPKETGPTSKKASKDAKSRELSKTLSNLSTQSPLLFNTPVEKSSKRLKTEESMTVTTKIEISSNIDGDLFNIKRSCERPQSGLSEMLNDCIINNVKLSQQLLNSDDLPLKTTATTDDLRTNQNCEVEDDHELNSSLRSTLDEVVNTNVILSQKIMNDADSFKSVEINKEKKSKEKKKKKDENKEQETKKTNMKAEVQKGAEKSKENIRTGAIPSIKTNSELGQSFDVEKRKKKPSKSKENIKASKSKENCGSSLQSKEMENQKLEEYRMKLVKKIRALCSEEDDQLEGPVLSDKDVPKKNKTTDSGKKLLRKKMMEEYVIEKEKSKNIETEKNRNKINLKKKQTSGGRKCGGKKLEKKKSSTGIKIPSSTIKKGRSGDNGKELGKHKPSRPPKPKNMIFTSENPMSNELNLKKVLELQEERDVGLYVYCDTCNKVRYLEQCKDPLDLPAKWYCYMNPDQQYNKCSDPDFEIEPEQEELIISNKFNAGSIVWAKMDGYPWWPAMVDDDPDVTDYFWLDDEESKEPSWYHVTFFDSSEVTRAWIRTANLEPFEINAKNPLYKLKKYNFYRARVAIATSEAKTACKMGILERLRRFSFVTRYFKKCEEKKRQKGRSKKNDAICEQHDVNMVVQMDKNDELRDNLSVASSDIISSLLSPPKRGKNNKLASEDDILENIDFNHFICDEDAFDTL